MPEILSPLSDSAVSSPAPSASSVPTLETMLAKRLSVRSSDGAEENRHPMLPAMYGKTDLSLATAHQAAAVLGVSEERIRAVLLKRFHRSVKGHFRFDIQLLFALKEGFALDGIDPGALAKARRQWATLIGENEPVPPAVPSVGFDLIRDALRPQKRVKCFAERLHAYDSLMTSAARFISGLSDVALNGRVMFDETVAYKGGRDADNAGGVWRGFRLTFRLTGEASEEAPEKRMESLLKALFGIGRHTLGRVQETWVFGEAAVESPQGEAFTREMAVLGAEDPDIARFWVPIEAVWEREGLSLARELRESMRPATFHWKGEDSDWLAALEAYAVFFADLEAVTERLEKALPRCIRLRDEAAMQEARRAELRAQRLREAELAARRKAEEEAAELRDLAQSKARAAHRHLASLGLASQSGSADIPNLYCADEKAWLAFCKTPSPVIVTGRRRLKSFIGTNIGHLFGYDLTLEVGSTTAGYAVLTNGLPMPAAWLADKAELLMRTGADISTGELVRPDGSLTTPEELFFGIRRTENAARQDKSGTSEGESE